MTQQQLLFEKQSNQSANDFNISKEHLTNIFGGQIYPVEYREERVARDMDIYCGIDYYIKYENGIRGLAFRSQHSPNYQTFTIRKDRKNGSRTEFDKLADAFKNEGYMHPYFTVQQYVQPNGNVAVGIVKTQEIYEYILQHQDTIKIRKNPKDETEFYVIPWAEIHTKVSGFNLNGLFC